MRKRLFICLGGKSLLPPVQECKKSLDIRACMYNANMDTLKTPPVLAPVEWSIKTTQPIASKDLSPLDVLKIAMCEHFDAAERYRRAESIAILAGDLDAALEYQDQVRVWLRKACDIARIAAPYVHPRLISATERVDKRVSVRLRKSD